MSSATGFNGRNSRPLAPNDQRLTVPLYTGRQVANYVRVPSSTIRNWVRGYEFPVRSGRSRSRPIIVSVAAEKGGYPTIPFMGLAEALVLASFRHVNRLSLQKIRLALKALELEVGVHNVLANKALYVAGAEILWDYAKRVGDDDIRELVEPGTGQRVFTEPIRQYLQLITYGADQWASRIALPAFEPTRVVVDMKRGFGRPIIDRQRVRVDDITDRFFHGRDRIPEIAADLELDEREVEDVIRAASEYPTAA